MTLTPEQLAARKNGIGGSDAAAACGQDPWKTPTELWVDKTDPDYSTPENAAMRFGTLTEPVVRQLYADATGRTVVTPTEMVRCAIPWMFAHLDGIANGTRNVQCKTSRTNIGWGEPGTDEIPAHYLFQVQHEMLVGRLEVTDIPVLFGNFEFAVYEVPADREFQDLLIEREREFWRLVETRTPPEIRTGRDALLRWPRSRAMTVTASPRDLALVQHIAAIRAQIALLDTEREYAEGCVKASIGEAEAIACGGKTLATWKSVKPRESFDRERFQRDHPDLFQQYLSLGAPSRRFCLKETLCLQTNEQPTAESLPAENSPLRITEEPD
jgi:putative phage-type endonuclease